MVALGACGRAGFDLVEDGDGGVPLDTPESGLLAHWRLDETDGVVAFDSSGHGHHGTLIGGSTWQPTDGTDRGALRSDWSSPPGDGVDANYPALHVTGSFSIAAWVRYDALSASGIDGVQNIAGIGTDSPLFFAFRLTQNTRCGAEHFALRVSVDDMTPSRGAERCSTTVLTTGRWYHVVGVYTATTPAIDLYVDGQLASGAMCPAAVCGTTTIPTGIARASSAFTIGGDLNLKNEPNGLIDDVRVYDRALTAAEVASLHASTGSGT